MPDLPFSFPDSLTSPPASTQSGSCSAPASVCCEHSSCRLFSSRTRPMPSGPYGQASRCSRCRSSPAANPDTAPHSASARGFSGRGSCIAAWSWDTGPTRLSTAWRARKSPLRLRGCVPEVVDALRWNGCRSTVQQRPLCDVRDCRRPGVRQRLPQAPPRPEAGPGIGFSGGGTVFEARYRWLPSWERQPFRRFSLGIGWRRPGN